MSNNIFVILVHRLEASSMYKEYLINLPEGLNNPYLLLLIMIGLGIYLIFAIADRIKPLIAHIRKPRVNRPDKSRSVPQPQEVRQQTVVSKEPVKIARQEALAPIARPVKSVEPKKQTRSRYKRVSNAKLFGMESEPPRPERSTGSVIVREEQRTPDYAPILEEKRSLGRVEERADGLSDIMANIENKRRNEQALRFFEERNNATKQHNMEILDRSVKKNLRVEKKRVKENDMREDREIKRGDVYYVFPDDNTTGSEQRSGRPGVVVSNNKNNRYSSVMEIVYITKQDKKDLPTHVKINLSGTTSTVLCEQVDSVSIKRLGNYMGHVNYKDMAQINAALSVSLGL